jgi:hypothetical protein
MSRNSKNAKRIAQAREVTTQHKAGKAAGKTSLNFGSIKNQGKSQHKREMLAASK